MKIKRTLFISLPLILLLTLIVSAATAQSPPVTEMRKYMVIAMADKDDILPFNMSNTELGANREVLSTPTSAPWVIGFPNLLDVFDERWNLTTDPDQINGAAVVVAGIEWTGNVALTSDNSMFSAANSLVFANRGVESGRPSGTPLDSVSTTNYYTPTEQTPVDNPISLLNGVSIGHDFSPLLGELTAWKSFIESLPADLTITEIPDFSDPSSRAVDGDGGLRTTYTNTNPLEDDFIVVDFDVDGDFTLDNIDWVIHSAGGEPIIFRVLNGSNMTMANSSILMSVDSFDPTDRLLGGTFYHASEPTESGDAVFTLGNNTVLNGIGLWDMNAIGEGGNMKTKINVQNGQGCTQFVGQSVNFSNGRWARCVQAPTAITLAGINTQPASNPSMALLLAGGLLLLATLVLVATRLRRSEV